MEHAALIHFGCLSLSNKYVNDLQLATKIKFGTIFHGNYGYKNNLDTAINLFIRSIDKYDKIRVSSQIMYSRLINWGVEEEKLFILPIGVDTKLFFKYDYIRTKECRSKLGIPDDHIIIGSFQKDDEGDGSQSIPKLIKGPDIFVETMEILQKQVKILCLLTGPTRNYVKSRLAQIGIPWIHFNPPRYFDMPALYNCLDFYIVSSRDEGGPKGLVESYACGVPVFSTNVGMANEILSPHYIVNDDNASSELADLILKHIKLPSYEFNPSFQGKYDWSNLRMNYEDELIRAMQV